MPEKVIKDLGTTIRKRRIRNNLTQEELAEQTGISKKHIANMEKGIANGSFEIAAILAKRLNFSLDLIVYSDSMNYVDESSKLLATKLISCTKEQQEIVLHVVDTMIIDFHKLNKGKIID